MKSWKAFLCSVFVCLLLAWAAVGFANEIVVGYTGPLSGPAAEYGQDCVNGVDMAVRELNAAGGVTVKGKKYTFRLDRLDDRVDPTLAKNNAVRLVSQNKALAVFVPIGTTLGSVMSIPQHDFIIAAYTSVHTFMDKGHDMIITPTPNFVNYAQLMSQHAWDKGWRKAAMVVTLGAYGDAWRSAFHQIWIAKGGKLVGDYPANYFTETDFSSQLASAMAKKPDVMLIGGPSAITALVIEQARNMGYKGGFIMIDQAKPEYVAKVLRNMKLMEGTISTSNPEDLPLPIVPSFMRKYKAAYKRDANWEVALNYNMMHIIARAIQAADSTDAKVVRRNIYKALPTLGDKYPNELFGIDDRGVMFCGGNIQKVENGKFSKVDYTFSFPKTQAEFLKYKKMSKSSQPEMIRWVPLQ